MFVVLSGSTEWIFNAKANHNALFIQESIPAMCLAFMFSCALRKPDAFEENSI